jgi:hypothetical protein
VKQKVITTYFAITSLIIIASSCDFFSIDKKGEIKKSETEKSIVINKTDFYALDFDKKTSFVKWKQIGSINLENVVLAIIPDSGRLVLTNNEVTFLQIFSRGFPEIETEIMEINIMNPQHLSSDSLIGNAQFKFKNHTKENQMRFKLTKNDSLFTLNGNIDLSLDNFYTQTNLANTKMAIRMELYFFLEKQIMEQIIFETNASYELNFPEGIFD